jgi:hypothetical protein
MFRWSLTLKPQKEFEQRHIIKPKGTKSCKEVDWDWQGHSTPVNTVIGICRRFFYSGMVTMVGGTIVATVSGIRAKSPMAMTGPT